MKEKANTKGIYKKIMMYIVLVFSFLFMGVFSSGVKVEAKDASYKTSADSNGILLVIYDSATIAGWISNPQVAFCNTSCTSYVSIYFSSTATPKYFGVYLRKSDGKLFKYQSSSAFSTFTTSWTEIGVFDTFLSGDYNPANKLKLSLKTDQGTFNSTEVAANWFPIRQQTASGSGYVRSWGNLTSAIGNYSNGSYFKLYAAYGTSSEGLTIAANTTINLILSQNLTLAALYISKGATLNLTGTKTLTTTSFGNVGHVSITGITCGNISNSSGGTIFIQSGSVGTITNNSTTTKNMTLAGESISATVGITSASSSATTVRAISNSAAGGMIALRGYSGTYKVTVSNNSTNSQAKGTICIDQYATFNGTITNAGELLVTGGGTTNAITNTGILQVDPGSSTGAITNNSGGTVIVYGATTGAIANNSTATLQSGCTDISSYLCSTVYIAGTTSDASVASISNTVAAIVYIGHADSTKKATVTGTVTNSNASGTVSVYKNGVISGTITNAGTLNVSGGSVGTITNSGTTSISSGSVKYISTDGGTVTVSGGTVGGSGEEIGIYNCAGIVNVSGGTVEGYDAAIYMEDDTPILRITGGTIKGTDDDAIDNDSASGTITMSAGKIEGIYGIYTKGNITMTGGTIDTDEASILTKGKIQLSISNATLQSYNNAIGDAYGSTITITNSSIGDIVTSGTLTITGGTSGYVDIQSGGTALISGGTVGTIENNSTATRSMTLAGSSYTVTVGIAATSSASTTVASINNAVAAVVQVRGYTTTYKATVSGTVTNSNSGGEIIFNQYALISGNCTNAGTLRINGSSSTITNTGTLFVNGSSGVITNSNSLSVSGGTTGAITNNQGGTIAVFSGTTGGITNNSTSTRNMTLAGSSYKVTVGIGTNSSSTTTVASINNTVAGSIRIKGYSSTYKATVSGNITNSGSGNITVEAYGTVSGSIINSGSVYIYTNGTVSGAITNAGILSVSGTVTGIIINEGTAHISGTTNAITNDDILSVYGGTTGSITNNAGGTIEIFYATVGAIENNSTSIYEDLEFEVEYEDESYDYYYYNATIGIGINSTVASINNKVSGGVIVLRGYAIGYEPDSTYKTIVSGAVSNAGELYLYENSTIGGTFTNTGTLRVDSRVNISGATTNSGTMNVVSGTVSTIANTGTVNVSGGTTGKITNSGTLNVSGGTVNGIVTSAGTVTIGTSGGTPSTTSPVIQNSNGFGLEETSSNTTTVVYDGVIKGKYNSDLKTTTACKGYKGTTQDVGCNEIVNTIPSGYGFTLSHDTTNGITSSYLVSGASLVELSGIPDVVYQTVQSAVMAQTNATIKVLKDVTECLMITGSANLTLNLNGKIITGCSDKDYPAVTNAGTLTINGNGTITTTTYHAINNSGTLTLTNGTITGTRGIYSTAGTVTINGGKITGSTSDGIYISSTSASALSMTNGEVVGADDAIQNGSTGTISISGGTVTGFAGVWNAGGGTVSISGGTFSATNASYGALYNSKTATVTGGTFTGKGYGINNASGGTANISGVSITAEGTGIINAATLSITSTASGKTTGTITNTGSLNISGGTTGAITNNSGGTVYISRGTTGAITNNSTSTRSMSLAGTSYTVTIGISSNSSGGTTVVSVNNTVAGTIVIKGYSSTYKATISGTVTNSHASGTVTVYGNGVISGATTNAGTLNVEGGTTGEITNTGTTNVKSGSTFAITNSGTVNVSNGSASGITNSGTVNVTGGTVDAPQGITSSGGSVNISGGKVQGSHGISSSGGSVSISSGTVKGTASGGDGVYLTSTSTLTVTGGTITGSDSGIQSAGTGAINISGSPSMSGVVGIWNAGGASLTISGGTFTGNSSYGGAYTTSGGTITGGTYAGQGYGIRITAGTTSISGVTISATGTGIINAGTLDLSATVTDVNNSGTGTVEVKGGETGAIANTSTSESAIKISGGEVASLNTSAGTSVLSGGKITGTVTNSATFNVNSGTVSGTTTNENAFNVMGGSVGAITNKGTVNIYGGSTGAITNNGTLSVYNATVGAITNTGTTNINATQSQTSTITNNSGLLNISGGTTGAITNNGTGTVYITGGITGAITNNSNGRRIMNLAGTEYEATIGISSNSTGATTVSSINNTVAGTIVIKGYSSTYKATISGTVTNSHASGTVTVYGNGVVSGTTTNAGTLNVSGGTTVAITNNSGGTTKITSGSTGVITNDGLANIYGGETGTITNNGTLSIYSGTVGAITNTGTTNLNRGVTGAITNSATLKVSGGTVNGGITTSAGTVTIGASGGGTPDTTSPVIQNDNGVVLKETNSNATTVVYDGIFKQKGALASSNVCEGYNGTTSDVGCNEIVNTKEDGHGFYYGHDGTYTYAYLVQANAQVEQSGPDHIYNSIQEAINNNNNKTILLLANVTECLNVPAKHSDNTNKVITLNLNGKTLTCSTSNTPAITNAGALTVDGNGIVKGYQGIQSSAGTVTFKSGKIEASNDGINITSTSTSALIVEAGEIIGGDDGIQNGSTGTITISGGTVTGVAGIWNTAGGSVVINGGIFSGAASHGAIYNTLAVDGNGNAKENLTITGGTFTGPGYGIKNAANAIVSIRGVDITASGIGIINEGILNMISTASGKTTGVITNTGALDVKGGTTGAITNSGTLTVDGGITGAVTNSGTTNVKNGSTGAITNTGTLNVEGGTVRGTTGITSSAGQVNISGGVVNGTTLDGINISGTTVLTITGGKIYAGTETNGTISGGDEGISVSGGSATVSGSPTIAGVIGLTNYSGIVSISGGTFIGTLATLGASYNANGAEDSYVITGGTFEGIGYGINNYGGTAVIGGITVTASGDKIRNSGTLTVNGIVRVNATTYADIANTGSLSISGATTGNIANSGTTNVTRGSVASITNMHMANIYGGTVGDITNSGILTVYNATVGDITNSGTTNVNAGATGVITNNSGSLNISGGTTGAITNNGSGTVYITRGITGTITNNSNGRRIMDLAGTEYEATIGISSNSNGATTVESVLNDKTTTSSTLPITIILKGYSATYKATITGTLTNNDNTLGNITIYSNGVVNGVTTNSGTINVSGGTTGNITNNSDGAIKITSGSIGTINNAGSININGGSTVSITNGGSANIYGGETGTITNSGTLSIYSGTVGAITNTGTTNLNRGVTGEITNSGTLNVSSVTVNGGITTSAGTVTIGTSGGTPSTTSPVIQNDNGVAIKETSSSATVKVYDGIFKQKGALASSNVCEGYKSSTADVGCNEIVDEKESGYGFYYGHDGTYTYAYLVQANAQVEFEGPDHIYNSIQDAIDDNNDITILVLNDVTECLSVINGKTLTLDMNGYSVSCSTANTYTLTNAGSFTVKGAVSKDSNGVVVSASGLKSDVYSAISNSGTLTLSGGVYAGVGTVISNTGKLNTTGEIVDLVATVNAATGKFVSGPITNAGELNINGGIIGAITNNSGGTIYITRGTTGIITNNSTTKRSMSLSGTSHLVTVGISSDSSGATTVSSVDNTASEGTIAIKGYSSTYKATISGNVTNKGVLTVHVNGVVNGTTTNTDILTVSGGTAGEITNNSGGTIYITRGTTGIITNNSTTKRSMSLAGTSYSVTVGISSDSSGATTVSSVDNTASEGTIAIKGYSSTYKATISGNVTNKGVLTVHVNGVVNGTTTNTDILTVSGGTAGEITNNSGGTIYITRGTTGIITNNSTTKRSMSLAGTSYSVTVGISSDSSGATTVSSVDNTVSEGTIAIKGSSTTYKATISGNVTNKGVLTVYVNGVVNGTTTNTGALTVNGGTTGQITNSGALNVTSGTVTGTTTNNEGGTVYITGGAIGAITNNSTTVRSMDLVGTSYAVTVGMSSSVSGATTVASLNNIVAGTVAVKGYSEINYAAINGSVINGNEAGSITIYRFGKTNYDESIENNVIENNGILNIFGGEVGDADEDYAITNNEGGTVYITGGSTVYSHIINKSTAVREMLLDNEGEDSTIGIASDLDGATTIDGDVINEVGGTIAIIGHDPVNDGYSPYITQILCGINNNHKDGIVVINYHSTIVDGATNKGTLIIYGGEIPVINNSETGIVEVFGAIIGNVETCAICNEKGTVNIYDGVVGKNDLQYGIHTVGGTINISGGEVYGADAAIYMEGDNPELNISGGMIIGADDDAIDNDTPTGKINMSDGLIEGYFGIYTAGDVTITGGEINTCESTIYIKNNITLKISNAEMSTFYENDWSIFDESENSNITIASSSVGAVYMGTGTLNINSGTVGRIQSSGTLNVTGGTTGTIDNAGTANISGGETGLITNDSVLNVTGGTVNGIVTTAGTVTIGESGGTPSTTSPVIQNADGFALVETDPNAATKVYDGIIKGKYDANPSNSTACKGYNGNTEDIGCNEIIDNIPSGYGFNLLKEGNYAVSYLVDAGARIVDPSRPDGIYSTIQDAINSVESLYANVGEILLLRNATKQEYVDHAEYISIATGLDVTLDLNGFSLSTSDTTHSTITNAGTLLVKNSSNTTGEITHSTLAVIANSGTLEIQSKVNVSSNGTYAISSTAGGVTINGATIASGVAFSGGRLTVDSGTISATNIAINSSAAVVINNGTVSSSNGIAINMTDGSLEVKGGTVSSTNDVAIKATKGSITYTGGTLKGNKNKTYVYDLSSGVSYSTGTKNEYTKIDGNVYETNLVTALGGVASLQTAISNASSGATITLNNNLTEEAITITKNITLDLNDKILNHFITTRVATAKNDTPFITVKAGGTLTIKGGTIVSYNELADIIMVENGGVLNYGLVSDTLNTTTPNINSTNSGYAIKGQVGSVVNYNNGKITGTNQIDVQYRDLYIRDEVVDDNGNTKSNYHIVYKNSEMYLDEDESGEFDLDYSVTVNSSEMTVTIKHSGKQIIAEYGKENSERLSAYLRSFSSEEEQLLVCNSTGFETVCTIGVNDLPYLYNAVYKNELLFVYEKEDTNSILKLIRGDLQIIPNLTNEDGKVNISDNTSVDENVGSGPVYILTDGSTIIINISEVVWHEADDINAIDINLDGLKTKMFGPVSNNVNEYLTLSLIEDTPISIEEGTNGYVAIGYARIEINGTEEMIAAGYPEAASYSFEVDSRVLIVDYSPRLTSSNQTENLSTVTCEYGGQCVVAPLSFMDHTGGKVNNITNIITKDGVVVDSIDTSVLGTYVVTTTATDRFGYVSSPVIREYNVVDNKAPEAKVNSEALVVEKGSSLLDVSDIEVIDNYDKALIIERISDDVDLNKAGVYKLGYRVVDSNGNETVVYRDVIVKETANNNLIWYITGIMLLVVVAGTVSFIYIKRRK